MMDNGSFLKLRIMEDDIEGVLDMFMVDGRIEENVRKEYGEKIRKVLYAGMDSLVDGGGYSLNFK